MGRVSTCQKNCPQIDLLRRSMTEDATAAVQDRLSGTSQVQIIVSTRLSLWSIPVPNSEHNNDALTLMVMMISSSPSSSSRPCCGHYCLIRLYSLKINGWHLFRTDVIILDHFNSKICISIEVDDVFVIFGLDTIEINGNKHNLTGQNNAPCPRNLTCIRERLNKSMNAWVSTTPKNWVST